MKIVTRNSEEKLDFLTYTKKNGEKITLPFCVLCLLLLVLLILTTFSFYEYCSSIQLLGDTYLSQYILFIIHDFVKGFVKDKIFGQ